MGISIGPKPIVTDNLIFYADAVNPESMSPGGSTWTDIVGGVEGTINGATWNSSGYFDFDGSRKLEADGVMDPDDDGAGTDIWRYITYTRDASNSNAAVAYMDGVSVDTGTISSNQTQTAGSVGALDRGNEWVNGQIALFRMYKGIAFTPTQVLHNFNAQRGRFGV